MTTYTTSIIAEIFHHIMYVTRIVKMLMWCGHIH